MTQPSAAARQVPPQNIEAEESVLGAMLVAEPALGRVIDAVKLRAADFYLDKHKAIYKAIRDLHTAAKPIDELAVCRVAAPRRDRGGRRQALHLGAGRQGEAAPGSAGHHAAIVQQNSLLRRLLGAGQEIQGWVHQRDGAPHELSRRAEQMLGNIRATGSNAEPASIVTAQEFAAVEEPGAEPLVGEAGEAVVPEGGDVMLYGDGGASKTTLGLDLGVHLAAADPWLGIPVTRPATVLLVEAEGPRPLFRDKVQRKIAAWNGSDLGGRLLVLERPWADFRFPDAAEIADLIGERQVDVLIVGPLTRVGMEELGTLQQVRDFMAEVDRFRERSGRRLTVFLVHHENKGGSVSGAWEGAGDTLLHAQVHAPGKTTLTFQKARWSSRWHKQTLELDWTEGEGFEVVEEPARDLGAEVEAWLRENSHSTAKEIAVRRVLKQPDGTEEVIQGIGAREEVVSELLNGRLDIFRVRTGQEAREVGRHPTARVWEIRKGAPTASENLGAPTPPGEVQ